MEYIAPPELVAPTAPTTDYPERNATCSSRAPIRHHAERMNANRSALIWSACVVGIPCGKPG